MKKSVLFLINLFFLGILALNAQEMSDKEKNAYAGGVLLAEKIKSEELEFIIEDLKEGGFSEALRAGFRDAVTGEVKLSKEEIMNCLESFQQKVEALRNKEKEKENENKQKKESENASQCPIDHQLTIARYHAGLSWYYLFIKDYAQAEKSARKALKLDNTYLIPKTNLAHALLFQNRFSKAETIYKELLLSSNETYSETLLKDFDELEKAGVIPEKRKDDVEKIRKMLNNFLIPKTPPPNPFGEYQVRKSGNQGK